MLNNRKLFILQFDQSVIDWIKSIFVDLDQSITIFEPSSHFKNLLGQDQNHVLFDASKEFNLDHFMMLTGTLTAKSLCILLLPKSLDDFIDQSSLRWNQSNKAKNTPHFNHYLKQVIEKTKAHFKDCDIAELTQSNNLTKDKAKINQLIRNLLDPINTSIPFNYSEIDKNAEPIASFFRKKNAKYYLISGKRGRGKSTILGRVSKMQSAWLTAPSKASAVNFIKMNPGISFYAPDQLAIKLSNLEKTDKLPEFLYIDEVAMIPLALTKLFLAKSWNVVMMTTTEGYEGTGQGILQKLNQDYPIVQFQLEKAHRFLEYDPIEFFTEQLILSEDKPEDKRNIKEKIGKNSISYSEISQFQMAKKGMHSYWQLLKKSHYKTNLSDLRRLFDGDGLYFYQACFEDELLGLLMTIEEGSLNLDLIEKIMSGYRRPKGNLFVQSLAAHAFCSQAAQLRSRRIHRIAVIESMRRTRIATELINRLKEDSQKEQYDFLSVSFSYDESLLNFWTKLGFILVHIGTSQETATGEQAMMMMYALNEKSTSIQQSLQTKLARDAIYLKSFYKPYQQFISMQSEVSNDFTEEDLQMLKRFSQTQAAYSAIVAALFRFISYLKIYEHELIKNCIFLSAWDNFTHPFDFKSQKIGSKKIFIAGLRHEINFVLQQLNKTN